MLPGDGGGGGGPTPAAGGRSPRLLAVAALAEGDERGADDELARAEERLAGAGVELRWGHPLRVTLHPEVLAAALSRRPRRGTVALTSQRAVQALALALQSPAPSPGSSPRPSPRPSSRESPGPSIDGLRLACLSGRTAEAARALLGREPEVTAEGGGRALARALLSLAGGPGPVLFPRAADGRAELPQALAAAGVEVEVVAAYDSEVDPRAVAEVLAWVGRGGIDAAAFGSPRGAAALLDAGLELAGVLVGAIGPTTAAALLARNVAVARVAPRPSFAALLDELGAELASPARIS